MSELSKILQEISTLIEIGVDSNHDKIKLLHKEYKKIVKSMRPEEVLFARLLHALDQYKATVSG